MAQGLAMFTKITPHSAGGGTGNGSNSNSDGNRSNNNSVGRITKEGRIVAPKETPASLHSRKILPKREVEAAPVGCDKCYYVD